MHRLLVLPIALALAACGNQAGDSSTPPPPSTHHSARHASSAPPAAYLVTGNARVEMTMGTYCWISTNPDGTSVGNCGDSMPFADFPKLASTPAGAGDTVRVVLGFEPTRPIDVAIDDHTVASADGTVVVTRPGILTVFARAPQGDVSYGIRLTGG